MKYIILRDKYKFNIKEITKDNIDYIETEGPFDDSELTKQAMNLSTSSFSIEWDKEDDDFWNNY